jgi:cysteine desulfuration protein SufE
MNSPKEIEKEIIEEFEIFGDDWESKYEHLIDLGKKLPLISEDDKTDERLIKGCQSRLWLKVDKINDVLSFTADSDAIITKGMAALVLRPVNHQKAKEIYNYDYSFIEKTGLKEHLSPTRANGLISLIQQIKLYAKVLQ